MKNIIMKNSEFREGNEIYNPKTGGYFKIITSYYMKNYEEDMVFLVPLNSNPGGNAFSYRLSHLICEVF